MSEQQVGGNGHIWGQPLKISWAFYSLCLLALFACKFLLRGLPCGYHSYFRLQVMLPILLPIDLWLAFHQNAIYSEQIKFCHRLMLL